MTTYPQPGDVAMVTALNRPTPYRAYYDGETWREYSGRYFCVDTPADIRPLVVIDPEDREQTARLAKVLVEAAHTHGNAVVSHNGIHPDTVALALREFTTPKPPEPTGLGAVVEDAEGDRWLRWEIVGRHPKPWTVAGAVKPNRTYGEIAAVRVLSEGVPQ